MNPKYSVLTYSFGNYEKVHEIQEKDPEAEYLLITDNPSLKSDTWEVVFDSRFIRRDPIFCSWLTRFSLFDFAHSDVCITLDGSMQIRQSLRPFYDMFQDGAYDMALMPHPCRSTLVDEYKAWISGRKYPIEQANKCLVFMQKLGLDPRLETGIVQGCMSIRRDNKLNDDFQRICLDFLRFLSDDRDGIERIDQNIQTLVLYKLFRDIKILPLSEQAVRSEAITWCIHGTDTPKLDAYSPDGKTVDLAGKYDLSLPDMKILLGRKVQCFYFKDGQLTLQQQHS